ncbi:MAG: molybdopterin molybdotransferase MoeA [Acidobacteriia bacterium]|nr:molybdopterin molybdotransferase MoeA [Terriglobia bacterium]
MEPIVLSFEDARRRVEQAASEVHTPEAEECQLLRCGGRVLAETVLADRDFPPFPRATRDGYALRAATVATVPARLKLVGEIRAGGPPQSLEIHERECVEIMTGAPVPGSADAVVMVEHTSRTGGTVEIQRRVVAGENIVPAGAEAKRGDALLRSGTRLSPAAVAVAGSCGRRELHVFKRPRVAILSTGDELVDIAAVPAANQIRNSNSYSLAAQVNAAGGVPVVLPIAPDEVRQLRRLVQEGLASELLLMSGGVSMGKYDLVEQALHELGAEFFFTGAQIQPGRPVVFGRAPARSGAQPTYFFGLPGNPVSTMVCFELFARAMVEALGGAKAHKMMFTQARLKSDVKVKTGLTRFLPAILSGEYERTEVELVRWQGSGDMAATARANCYLVVPPDREKLAAGEMVSILPAE